MARDLSDVRFLTVAEVADMMRVSNMTVYRMVHSGEMPAIRFGRSFRIPETAVEAAIQLPSDARLWIFAAERPLSNSESARVLEETDSFIGQWMAHGAPLTAGRDLRYDQFVLVGVDERAAGVSGCSIDALVRRMQQLESVLGLELVNNAPVLYREGETIARVSRDRFAQLAASGTVGPNTRVFDNTLSRVGDLQAGKWEVKAAEAWHKQAFF